MGAEVPFLIQSTEFFEVDEIEKGESNFEEGVSDNQEMSFEAVKSVLRKVGFEMTNLLLVYYLEYIIVTECT